MNSDPTRGQRVLTVSLSVILIALDLAFLSVLLVLPVVWIGDPFQWLVGTFTWGPKLILTPVVLLVVRWLIQHRAGAAKLEVFGLWASPFFKRMMLALLSMYVFIALCETTLALVGFKAELPAVVFVSKNQSGETVVQNSGDIPDPVLLWKFNPGALFANRRINRLGFRDREVDPEKKPGTIRVICMGDSITAQGRPGYSQYLHERLTNAPPTPQAWEAFNLGVHGYSSAQGLKLFQIRTKLLEPDIVTIYYGWNDHWRNDKTDHELMAVEVGALTERVIKTLQHKRLFVFLVWALNPRHRICPTGERPFRVPPEEYRSTLALLVRNVRASGAIPILVTAPRRNLTENLVTKGFANSPAEAEQTHDQYVAITREVARDARAYLLDLAALFAGKECDGLFAGDGIHFDHYEDEGELASDPRPQPGLMRIAAELDGKLREIVRRSEWQTLHGQPP